MTDAERALLILTAEYVQRYVSDGIGRIAGARQDAEDLDHAIQAVQEQDGTPYRLTDYSS